MLHEITHFIIDAVAGMGYWGIFFLMFIESTFFPFPSEVVMVPAGYLASQGRMDIGIVIFAGLAGSVAGALFNYMIALYAGRAFFLKYGQYLLVKTHTFHKIEAFFLKHGPISTFTGRLIPGIRQLISLPAGLARMDLKWFVFYTSLGAGIWVTILSVLGYIIGDNPELMQKSIHNATIWVLVGVLVILAVYIKFRRR